MPREHRIPVCLLRRLLCGLAAFWIAGSAFAQWVVEVIPLRYRTAEQVVPVIQPLLPKDGSVSGLQGQLIVRTTPANLAQIRQVLDSIDTPPKRLMITVRQDIDSDRTRRTAEVSGSIGNDHARVTVPGSGDTRGGNVVLREGDNRVGAHVIDTRRVESELNTQTLQVMEGGTAFIRVGESRPVRERQVVRTVVNGRVVDQVIESTQYRDANTGFHVRPRVSGSTVMLEISPQREAFDRDVRGAVNTQSLVTTASGRLGEWIELGGVSQDRSEQGSALLGRTTRSGFESRRVLVKVDELR